MKFAKLFMLAATLTTLASSAFAAGGFSGSMSGIGNQVEDEDSISLGAPGYGGSGCPGGSASVTLSPDGKSLTLIFDQFIVEAGGPTRKRIDRKNCDIAIPVHVPQGMSVSILEVDYRGFNALPSGAMARFSSEYFFAGSRGPQFSRTFMGPLNQDYVINNKLGVQGTVWSPCGADVNLRVNASMMTQTNRYLEDALSTVDTADFRAAMVYHLQWQRCQ